MLPFTNEMITLGCGFIYYIKAKTIFSGLSIVERTSQLRDLVRILGEFVRKLTGEKQVKDYS